MTSNQERGLGRGSLSQQEARLVVRPAWGLGSVASLMWFQTWPFFASIFFIFKMLSQWFLYLPKGFLKAKNPQNPKNNAPCSDPTGGTQAACGCHVSTPESVVGTGLLYAPGAHLELDELSFWPFPLPVSHTVEKDQSHREAEAWGSKSVFLIKEFLGGKWLKRIVCSPLTTCKPEVGESRRIYLGILKFSTQRKPQIFVFSSLLEPFWNTLLREPFSLRRK